MKEVKFKISSGQNVLGEFADAGMMLASLRGIIAEYGNGDSFIIGLSKETVDIPDPKPLKEELVKTATTEIKKDKK